MAMNILDMLERTAERVPDKAAVVDERGEVTFSELRERARRIGSALADGGLAGAPVAVALEKGADAVAACLGVLYAGGCYAPVDPVDAGHRLGAVVRALGSGAAIVRGADGLRAAAAAGAGRALDVEALLAHPVDGEALSGARAGVLSTDCAYVMFTSGSTGAPKGVAVSHRAVVEFVSSFTGIFGIDETDVIGNQAPFDFDVSVKDVYGAIRTGATLVVLPRRLFSEPAALVRELRERRVTTLTWAVAALCLVTSLHALEEGALPDVRRVLFSGEAMPGRHLDEWLRCLPRARFANLYGPTEVTCNCLYHEIDRSRDYADGIPLGIPFPDHEVLLLDAEGRAVSEAGAEGEICVRSPQLALGYFGDRPRTIRAFVPNPLDARLPSTVYRTGDRARLTASGELVFCGRLDNQVKHMGHRIELEEVDGAVERFDGVSRCRCAYDAARHRILAFFEGTASPRDLARAVGGTLPAHLAPSAYVAVPTMPLTKNGKVDRRALLASFAPRRGRP